MYILWIVFISRSRIYRCPRPDNGHYSHGCPKKYLEQISNESKDSAEDSQEEPTTTRKMCKNCRFNKIGNGEKNINKVYTYSAEEEPTLKNH